MQIHRKLLVPVLLLLFFEGASQSRRFEHLTSADGISQSEVYTFLKDSRGFVWFGTLDGLNRYDGNIIEVFNTKKGDPHALSNNTIRSLAEDRFGRIWIGTDDGLNFYDPETELINQVKGGSTEEKFTIWSLSIEQDHLLVGTEEGLWRTLITSSPIESIESDFTKINGLSNNPDLDPQIRALQSSKYGGVWIITANNISRVVFQENSNDPVLINDISFDDFSNIIAGIEDVYGNLWVASSKNGLIRYKAEMGTHLRFDTFKSPYKPSSQYCSSLAIDASGNLWLGMEDQGINFIDVDRLNDEEILFENIQNKPGNPHSLNSNLVYSLYVSNDNILWVGTIGSGINIYNPEQKKFQHYMFYNQVGKPPVSNFIRSVYAEGSDDILTGTHNNGLFKYHRENETFDKLGFANRSIFYIYKYQDNKFFICSGRGLFLVEINGNDMRILSSNTAQQQSAVFYIEKSKEGVYWYASLEGLVRMSVEEDEIIYQERYSTETSPAISADNCRVIYYNEDSNELLLGTEGGGLDILSLNEDHYPAHIRVFRKSEQINSLSNNYIRSIIKDRNRSIWIGTYEGLNKMICDSVSDIITFKSYSIQDGLPNNMIQLIAEDESGNLWIGTNGGLSKLIPDEEQFINYTSGDGIQGNEFSEHAVYVKDDGEIIMGGINGLIAFYPDKIIPSELRSKATITDFYLNNNKVRPQEKIGRDIPLKKSIVLTDTLILLPRQRNIGFEFSGMIYPNAENVKYEYMLEGFDENWHPTDARNRFANYTNLKYGDYIFKVRSSNSDAIWDSEREIQIKIQKPFRYTWMAFILYTVLIILILFYFSHFTIIRYATKKRLVLEKEHSEKLHELDELRTKFFINISHDLRTPLTLIREPLEKLLQNDNLGRDIRSKLELIHRNVKRLSYLVEQLLDVRKAESGRLIPKLVSRDIISFAKEESAHFSYAIKKKGIELNIHSSSDSLITSFDQGMLSKVFFNLISNAIKFTDEGRIDIIIEKVSKENYELLNTGSAGYYTKVEIRDTGRGIDANTQIKVFDRFFQDKENGSAGYGIGLSHARELIIAHEGFIELESEMEIGTTIRFFLPYIEKTSNLEPRSTSTEDLFISEGEENPDLSDSKTKFERSILIVEDNDDMRRFIAEELQENYNVLLASDGVEGLSIAETEVPDLIVSDVMMSNMDGIEFCKEVKSNIKISHIPIILLTAKSDDETKYQGIETGADDYIIKPFEINYLLLRIKKILQSREELQKLFQKNHLFEPSAVTVTSIDEKFLEALKNAMEEELSNASFSINSLEAKMGMSHANFYRKIKNLTGQSGQELLQSMRMRRAHQILSENKGLRVSEVAYMVGFTNPKYFSKCFKEMFGYAPAKLKGEE